jgi:hypothetical protein
MRSLVDGVDHVYVPMTEASAAFSVLTEQLDLPVMWPFTSFGAFSSGGVSLGSIKLEIIEANTTVRWCTPQHPPQITGIAFRPATSVDGRYLAEVDARGVPRSDLEQFERGGTPAWTNLYFSDFISAAAGAFVCDYHVPQAKDLAVRRRVLEDCGGGRLGVLDAVELVITTRDTTSAGHRWQRLFDPLHPAPPLTWRPTVGPALTVMQDDEERVDHLALTVRSVDAASEVWREVTETELAQFPLRFVPTG